MAEWNGVSYSWGYDENSPEDWNFDGRWVDIYHLEVYDKDKRREGRAEELLQRLHKGFAHEGIDRVYILMGGGRESADFLREQGYTIKRIKDSGSVIAYRDL